MAGYLPRLQDGAPPIPSAPSNNGVGSVGAPTASTGAVRLLSRLKSTASLPVVHPTPPTVSYDANPVLYNGVGWPITGGPITLLGSNASFDNGSGKTYLPASNKSVGIEFFFTGQQLELMWTSEQGGADRVWLWVDDQPTTATHVSPTATTSGTNYVAHIGFASVGRRKITFYTSLVNAFLTVFTPPGATLEPVAHRPKIAFMGDSFFDATGAIAYPIDSSPFPTGLLLGAEVIQNGTGGTGYVAGSTPFGTPSRIARVASTKPDVVVLNGSVNDDGSPGVQAAAAATFAALATALPGVPVIVFGAQPSNAADTLSANRSGNIAAVKAAAAAAPNVIAFHDRVGTAAGVPVAWNSGATYSDGALVTFLGSVWRWTTGGAAGNASNPRTDWRWAPVTWDYYGTGQVGGTTGDGSRDTFLHSDGIHPTPIAAQADAARMAATILSDLSA